MNDTLRRLIERAWYLPILLFVFGGSALQAQTSVTFTVSASTDDADEHSGTVYVTDSYSLMSGYVGFRFQNVTIPAGATVTSATLDLYAYGSGTTSFSVDLTAEDADNPSTFSTSANNISSRTLTSAQTLWSLSSYTFTNGVAFTSPDFSSTIQEVIDRAGWSSGNSLVVITTPNSGNKGIWKYSGNTSYAPQLHITYTTSPDPAGTVLMVTAGSSLTSEESARQTQFESWGYTVNTIEDGDSQANFDTAIAAADVIYVPQSVDVSSLAYKLRTSSKGVVHEGISSLDDNVGWTTSTGYNANTSQTMTITDNTHPVTDGLSTGTITIYTSSTGTYGAQINGTLASGAQQLGTNLGINSGLPSLVVFDKDAALANTYDGNETASGRRVHLPFGGFGTFSWSNLTSDSLTMIQNSLDWASVVSNGKTVLVVIDGTTPDTQEAARITQFEDWGYTVNTVQDSDTQANFVTALAAADVVYVPETISASSLSYKVREATVGVVVEERFQHYEMGFASSDGDEWSASSIQVTDNSHSITSGFATGSLTITSSTQSLAYTAGTEAPGAQALASFSGDYDLFVIETGAQLANTYNSSDVAFGRRVGLPIGGGFTWSSLNADGLTIVERSLDWASTTIATNSLIGHWKLDETSGTTAVDSSSYGNDGTYTNGPVLGGAGVYGYAPSFDGIEDYVTISGGSTYNLTENMTVSCWAKSDTSTWSGWGSLVSKRNQFYIHPSFGGTYIYFGADTAGSGDHTAGIDMSSIGSIQNWHHYVGVYDYDLGEVRFYVDGQLRATTSLTANTSLESDTGALTIGWDDGIGGTRYHDGQIDEVKLFNSALTDSEVVQLYGLKGHYKLDETSGTTATDSSGAANDGTYVGSPTLGGSALRGYSARFDSDAAAQYVDLPSTALDGASAVGVSWWMKTSHTGGQAVLSGTNSGSSNGNELLLFFSNSSTFRPYNFDSAPTYSLGSIADDRWHHYVYQRDLVTGVEQLYVDGELEVDAARSSSSSEFSIDPGGLMLAQDQDSVGGGFSTGQDLEGDLDHVHIYDRMLTDLEIAELFGRVGYWKLDETSGTVAADSSPLGKDLDAVGSPTVGLSGLRSYSAQFAMGTDEFRSASAAYEEIQDGVSIACWFYMDTAVEDLTGNVLLGTCSSTSSNEGFRLLIGSASDILRMYAYDGTNGTNANYTIADIGAGEWHQAVGVYDGTEIRLYVDGQLVGTQAQTVGLAPYDGPFQIGKNFPGRLDDVVLYNRAMTDEEIAEHYGLLLHLKLDETSGSLATDSSPFGHDGTISGAPTQAEAAIWDTGYDFESGDLITVSESDTLNRACAAGYESFAVAFWIHPDVHAGTWHSILQKGSSNVPRGPGIFLDSLNTALHIVVATTSSSNWGFDISTQLPEEEWSHVVVQGRQNEIEVYINGELDSTQAVSGSIVGATGPILIGQTYSYPSPGKLDDVRYYNRALSQGQISELYGLMGYWKLDESTGSLAYDSSGLGNDATLVASPTLGQAGAYVPETNMAFELDGSTEYADTETSLLNDLSAFTLSGWIRPDGFMQQQSFFGQNDAIEFGISSSGLIQLWTPGGGLANAPASAALAPSKWSHIIATGDGSNVKIYVDGVEVASGGYATSNYGSSAYDFRIGEGVWGGTGDYFDGRVDEVKVFSRAVGPDEARSLYKGGRPAGVRIIRWVETR